MSLSRAPQPIWTVAALVLSLLVTSRSAAQTTEPPASQPAPLPTLAPLHRLTLPDSPSIETAIFSADGQTLYVFASYQAINIWELLCAFWPELLGGLTGLLAVICLLAFWRIARRPQLPGQPHCRRCNYCLRGLESPRCPECGHPATPSRLGRTTRRRIAPFAAPLTLLACAYAALWASQVPRTGWFGEYFKWWSFTLRSLASARGLNLSAWDRDADYAFDIDVITGQIRAQRRQHPAVNYAPRPLAFPDGSGLLVCLDDECTLAILDPRTGKARRILTCPRPPNTLDRWCQFSGFSADGRIAYAVWRDERAKRTRLIAWDQQSGDSWQVFETGTDAQPSSGEAARGVWLVPGPIPKFVEVTSIQRVGEEELILRDPQRPDFIAARSDTFCSNMRVVAFSSDGMRLFMPQVPESQFRVYELTSGLREVDPLTIEPFQIGPNNAVRCGVTGRVVYAAFRHGLIVFDADAAAVTATCNIPPGSTIQELHGSPDGQSFAARVASSAASGLNFELLIYDLRSLPPP